MSSELDKLVEAVTELVVQELSQASARPAEMEPSPRVAKTGIPVLVAHGPEEPPPSVWAPLQKPEGLAPSALVWSGGCKELLPSACGHWKLETRKGHWSKVIAGYKGVVLLGGDLGLLGALAVFAGDGPPPAAAAVAALAAGKPVFLEDHYLEQFRRHSSRLSAGLVRRFEEFYRIVCSFGIEIGSSKELPAFLASLGSPAGSSNALSKSGGRDVVTVEDVEAVRRSGDSKLRVALGTIVTPLAAQKAAEWGIEVSFQ